jgi:hypothetical protein
VAISARGNAVAVWDIWQANSSQGTVIQASARPAQGAWGAVATLTSPSSSSSVPKVGMDANGNAVAIWLQATSTSSAIEAAYLPAGGSWTAPVAISAAETTAANPSLAVNSFGDAVAGWQTSNGQILVAERRAGVWMAPVSIAPASYRQGSPHVALNDRGDAAIAWTGRGTALAATRTAGGAWSTPVTISTQASGATARIALDNSGNAVMIFELVKYRRRRVCISSPGGGEIVGRRVGDSGDDLRRERLCGDPEYRGNTGRDVYGSVGGRQHADGARGDPGDRPDGVWSAGDAQLRQRRVPGGRARAHGCHLDWAGAVGPALRREHTLRAGRAGAAADRTGTQAFDRVRQYLLGRLQEPRRVRLEGVELEGGFVRPFGVDRKHDGGPERFEEVNRHAALLGARGSDDAVQFLAELCFLPRLRRESDEEVDRHDGSPRGSVWQEWYWRVA